MIHIPVKVWLKVQLSVPENSKNLVLDSAWFPSSLFLLLSSSFFLGQASSLWTTSETFNDSDLEQTILILSSGLDSWSNSSLHSSISFWIKALRENWPVSSTFLPPSKEMSEMSTSSNLKWNTSIVGFGLFSIVRAREKRWRVCVSMEVKIKGPDQGLGPIPASKNEILGLISESKKSCCGTHPSNY